MVWGVGNELLSDEGIGIHLIQALRRTDLPEGVDLIEAGTAGLELLSLLEGIDRLIIVDAMAVEGQPGTVVRFRPGDVEFVPAPMMATTHDLGIVEALTSARLLGWLPDTVIIGVIPERIELGLELTPTLAAKLPELVHRVRNEILGE